MKTLNTLLFLFFFFSSFSEFKSDIYTPKHFNSSIINLGDQIVNEINPHEIFVYQFESIRFAALFFRAIEKKTLIFGYSTNDIEELEITESDLVEYISKGYLLEFPIIDTYSTAIISLPYNNELSRKQQTIILVYCPLDISCSFFISIPLVSGGPEIIMNAINAQSFMFNINSLDDYYFTLQLSNEKDTTFYLNATTYSGVSNVMEIYLNDTIIDVNRKVSQANEIIYFNIYPYAKVTYRVETLAVSYMIFHYLFTEPAIEFETIEMDITKSYTISMNNHKGFQVNHHSFYKSTLLIVNIKAEDCNLTIKDLSNEVKIVSKTHSYYQLLFYTKNDYTFNIFLSSNDETHNTSKCTFYIYASTNEHEYKIITMESVPYTIRLSEEMNNMYFNLPYLFTDNAVQNSLGIDLFSYNNKDIFIQIAMNDFAIEEFSFYGFYHLNIPIETIQKRCMSQLTCNVMLIINSFDTEDVYVDFKISANRYSLQYIQKNTLIRDQFSTNFIRLFYTRMNKNDIGRIKMIYKTKGVEFYYKIMNTENLTKDNMINGKWIASSDYMIDEGTYKIDEDCIDECLLLIKILDERNGDTFMNYLLFVENNNHYIEGLTNEKIKGYFDYNKEKYTFRFTLLNINKFQLVLGGLLVKYQLSIIDSTIPCCDTFNEIYYPEEGSTFIDTVIGDGITKQNITFEVCAISTNPNPYLSLFEITVLPFEFSKYPIYQISDKKTIDCYTGKDNNKTYILLKYDRMHEYYTYVISFNGKQSEHFDMYYNCITFLSEEERVNIEQYVDKNSLHYTDIIGTISQIRSETQPDIVSVMMIETDVNTKFTFQISSEENELLLIKNEQRLFILDKNQNKEIIISDNAKTLKENYTYILEIEQIKGEGYINLFTKERIQGKKVIYLNSTLLEKKSKFNLITEMSKLFVNIKLSTISNDDYLQIKMVNHTTLTNYVFYRNPFPLLYGIKLQDNMNTISINLRLRSSFTKHNSYNFTNLKVNAFYTDKESFDLYQTNTQTKLKIIKDISIKYLFSHPVINIEEVDSSSLSKYPYIIIIIEELKSTINWTYPNIQFDIHPYITYNNNNIIPLTERRYHYHTLNNKNQVYLLNSVSPFIFIEFASCSGKAYTFSFCYSSGKEIQDIHTYIEYGKEIKWIENKENSPVIMNISSSDSINESDYYILKYSNQNSEYTENHFTFGNITIDYFPLDNKIFSKWETTKNNFYKNSTISADYYYYLYDYIESNKSHRAICSSLSPIFFESMNVDYKNWTNKTIPYSKIENIIVAYLSLDDEDFLVAYNPNQVDIIAPSHFWYWTILLFVIVLLVIVYCTYWVYKEIKNKEKEYESEETNEELSNQKRNKSN